MKNKSTILTFIVSFLVVGSLVAVFSMKNAVKDEPEPKRVEKQIPLKPAEKTLPQPSVIEKSTPSKDGINLDNAQLSPQSLLDTLVRVLQGGADDKTVSEMREREIINDASAETLRKLLEEGKMELSESDPLREIGSWDNGKKVRFEVSFKDGLKGTVDFEVTIDGKWTVSALRLPSGNVINGGASVNMLDMADSMAVADSFARAALASDLKTMKSLIDSSTVNNATIVGLCILFEEGEYSLRSRLPLKGMFGNDKNAGFLAYIVDRQNKSAGNIGMSLKNVDDKGWLVTEVSLNSLLDDYATRYAEGDSVYVPIVKNPKGGDSLALFFGFNEATLTPRSVKQLAIVAKAIKMDGGKKLQISGHTDDIGSDQYNMDLSIRRADAVKQALVGQGVLASQIEVQGYGKGQPRRTYASSADDATKEEVRRDNRRAEMYLDF